MKRILTLVFILCLSLHLRAEDDTKEVKSTIKYVTVFTKGAQVSREAKVNIPQGNSIIKFIGITPISDQNSIQVKADGNFTVLSVTHQANYFETPIKTEEIEQLEADQQKLKDLLEDEDLLINVLQEEETLILNHKMIGGGQQGVVVSEVVAAADFYRKRIKEIRLEKLQITRKKKGIQEQITQIQAQLNELNYQERTNTSEVLVAIAAERATTGDFLISYIVNSAGWAPHYDLRVKGVNSPVQLSYKANVYQSSGESWNDVSLTLSTGDPSKYGRKPILQPWLLNFYAPYARRNNNRRQAGVYSGVYSGKVRQVTGVITDSFGEPLIGASVMIKGTTTGVVTNFDGRYTLEVPDYAKTILISYTGYSSLETAINSNNMNIVLDEGVMLDEVVLTGRVKGIRVFKNRKRRSKKKDKKELAPTQPVPVEEIEKATTVAFKIDIPYDILTDGKQYVVQIKEHELKSYYEYYAAPKLDPTAFLTAQVTGWEGYNLLNGEASLFFEGTYLGRSYLDVQSVDDTLDVSLGQDNNIVVKRTRQKENTKKKFLSKKRIDTRGWDIEIRNKKKLSINMVVEDQIPVAVTEAITVEKEYEGAAFDEDDGRLTWKFKLAPKESKKMNFKYTVKYPKKKQVSLE